MNKKSDLRIDKGRIMSVWMILVIAIGLALLYYQAFQYLPRKQTVLIWMALSPILPAIWSSRRIIIFNATKKEYGLYTFILGFKFGKTHQLKGLKHFALYARDKIAFGQKSEYFELMAVDDQNNKYYLTVNENLEQLEKLVRQKFKDVPLKYINFRKL